MLNKNKTVEFLKLFEKTKKILPELELLNNDNKYCLFLDNEKLLDIRTTQELITATLLLNGIILGYTKAKYIFQ